MNPFPEKYELISFFESEPSLADDESKVPWVYNTLTFKYLQGDEKIIFEMSPSYREIKILWERKGHQAGYFKLNNVASIQVEESKDSNQLTAYFSKNSDSCEFKLRLKPFIQIEWGNE